MDLAMKMRPKNIDDIIGQPDITKEDSMKLMVIKHMLEIIQERLQQPHL